MPVREINSNVFGNSSRRFSELVEKQRVRNLAERWEYIEENWPDLANSLGFVPLLLKTPGGLPGWAIVAVPDDKVAYTGGLHYHLGQPELLLSAPHLSLDEQKAALNQLVREVFLGKRFADGTTARVGSQTVTFHAYKDATFNEYPTGILARFEEIFEDRLHMAGGTLPVLWTSLNPPKRVKAKPAAKLRKRAKPKPAAKPKKTTTRK